MNAFNIFHKRYDSLIYVIFNVKGNGITLLKFTYVEKHNKTRMQNRAPSIDSETLCNKFRIL